MRKATVTDDSRLRDCSSTDTSVERLPMQRDNG